MKIEDARLKQLIDAVANLFIQKATGKEDIGTTATEGILKCVTELKGNLEIKLTIEEAYMLGENFYEIMEKIMELAHKDNPSHDCKTCVLMYVCNPEEKERDEIMSHFDEIIELMHDIVGPVNKTKGDC